MQDHDRTASLMTPAKLAQIPPKARVSPAAWLNQMAADAGHQHVTRLGQLRSDLQAQAGQRDFSELATDLARLAEALPRLDFGLLQSRGLLARLTGKSRSAGAEFASQFDQIEAAQQALAQQAKTLQGKQGEQARGTDKTLLEFEVEFRALEKIIDQGARWLQDMRGQIKARADAAAADPAVRQQVQDDAARCEVLVGRLKALRAISTAAQEAHQQAQNAAQRRASLVQALQKALSGAVKDWRTRITPLANAARDGDSITLSLEGPMDCHRDLQLCIKQAIADCEQMQLHEKSLAESLEALGSHLAGA